MGGMTLYRDSCDEWRGGGGVVDLEYYAHFYEKDVFIKKQVTETWRGN